MLFQLVTKTLSQENFYLLYSGKSLARATFCLHKAGYLSVLCQHSETRKLGLCWAGLRSREKAALVRAKTLRDA